MRVVGPWVGGWLGSSDITDRGGLRGHQTEILRHSCLQLAEGEREGGKTCLSKSRSRSMQELFLNRFVYDLCTLKCCVMLSQENTVHFRVGPHRADYRRGVPTPEDHLRPGLRGNPVPGPGAQRPRMRRSAWRTRSWTQRNFRSRSS